MTSISFGQKTTTTDDLLSVKYSSIEISKMKSNDAVKYDLYVKSFKIGVNIIPYEGKVKEKGNTFKSLNIVSSDIESFNYLSHHLDLQNDSQYYLINEGKNLLIIKGIQDLNATH